MSNQDFEKARQQRGSAWKSITCTLITSDETQCAVLGATLGLRHRELWITHNSAACTILIVAPVLSLALLSTMETWRERGHILSYTVRTATADEEKQRGLAEITHIAEDLGG